MARREFVQLAQKYDPERTILAGASYSDKLDGLRCFYDGGITTGLPTTQVPWANTLRDKGVEYSTGLWTRLGKPINAHPDWLSQLPKGLALDGELYLGKSALEDTMAVKRDVPDAAFWKQVTYQVFDTPSRAFFDDGEVVYDAKTRKKVNFGAFMPKMCANRMSRFWDRHMFLVGAGLGGGVIDLVQHTQLSGVEADARGQLYDAFCDTVAAGGEGLMVRLPSDLWVPRRVNTLLKYKPLLEDVGTIVGYNAGAIGVDGTLRGKMGAIIVQWGDTRFKLSGFTNDERNLADANMSAWAWENAEQLLPSEYSMPAPFGLGEVIPFKYTSLTAAGIPREARYDRP